MDLLRYPWIIRSCINILYPYSSSKQLSSSSSSSFSFQEDNESGDFCKNEIRSNDDDIDNNSSYDNIKSINCRV